MRDWRKREGLSLAECAQRVGITGNNPARSFQRYETGEVSSHAVLADAISKLTGGEVTPQDLHDQRIEYLRGAEAAA